MTKRRNDEDCVYKYLIEKAKNGDFFTENGKLYRTFRRVGRGKKTKLNKPEEIGRVNDRGYVVFGLRYKGSSTIIMVHRLIYALHHNLDSIESNLVINHINGDKTDNRPENIELVTQQENIIHSLETGLRKVENNNTTKLDWDSVEEIRKIIKTKDYNNREIGELFGVSSCTIRKIRNGKSWVRREYHDEKIASG